MCVSSIVLCVHTPICKYYHGLLSILSSVRVHILLTKLILLKFLEKLRNDLYLSQRVEISYDEVFGTVFASAWLTFYCQS